MVINLRQLFGDQALEAMATLERAFGSLSSQPIEATSAEFADFTDAVENLRANPVVVDLCSIGLEVLAGLALRSRGWEGLVLGLDAPFRETTRDVDVLARRGDALVIVECKAHRAGKELTAGTVRKFLTETVPACRRWWTQHHGNPSHCRAEVWTSGSVGREAQDELARIPLAPGTEALIRGRTEIEDYLPSSIRGRARGLLTAISEGHRSHS